VLFALATTLSSAEALATFAAQVHLEAWESDGATAVPWADCAAAVERWRAARTSADAPASDVAAGGSGAPPASPLARLTPVTRAALECEWIRRAASASAEVVLG